MKVGGRRRSGKKETESQMNACENRKRGTGKILREERCQGRKQRKKIKD